MKAIVFGATGMVGQGVLRECLLDPEVQEVLVIGRSSPGQQHPRLRERLLPNSGDLSAIEAELTGYDACFFCLGVSSAGMTEAAYRAITYDLTLAAAQTLVKHNPGLTFVYVSGAGTDSTEHGRVMWARVKGATENALLKLPFKAVYMFRPGLIQAMHGVVPRARVYRILYGIFGPLVPLLRWLFPSAITTTELIGRAMLRVARGGAPRALLESRDINAIAAGAPAAQG